MLQVLRAKRFDLLAASGYLLLALFVFGKLWKGVYTRVQDGNVQDQIFFEWVLARAARLITHWENPFFSTQMNFPDGVNLMGNTSILAVAVPLAPITLLFGPQVSYAVMLTAALAGTAFAWYFVLSRHIVESRWAAALGGLTCAFSPGMISQGNGHPNLASQFVIPFIVWQALRLTRGERVVRHGLILGLLIACQAFINEELLLFTALATGLFVVLYAAQRRELIRPAIRPLLVGLTVAAGMALVVLAYPLYIQFLGPQHYSGLHDEWFRLKLDAMSYPAFGRQSLGVYPAVSPVSEHPAEENSFYGWPMCALVVAAAVWMWRNVAARTVSLVGLTFALMSLGPSITVMGVQTGIPGPWAFVGEHLVFKYVNPIRLGLITIPFVGVLIALACDRFLTVTKDMGESRRLVRGAGLLLVAAALVPIAPMPLPTRPHNPPPAFITAGAYRPYTEGGRTLVPVPLPTNFDTTGMYWSASTGLDFSMPWGYFIGPRSGKAGDVGTHERPERPTPTLLTEVETSRRPAQVTDLDRANARADLEYWKAGVVVLDIRHPASGALRKTLEDLLGSAATERDGVWFWDVRALTDSPSEQPTRPLS
jgi:Family of unknown function (DUF6541)